MSGWTSLITAGELETVRAALLRERVIALEWEVCLLYTSPSPRDCS